MPDEFPTLEVAVLIGTLVALVRTAELRASLRKVPTFMKALATAVKAGDLERARVLSDRERATTLARFGQALLEGLPRGDGAVGRGLPVERALARARASTRRGHARDLVVLAVLMGAGAHATRASLGVGRFFYGLLTIAVALTVVGALLRQRTLQALLAAAVPLAGSVKDAAATETEQKQAP